MKKKRGKLIALMLSVCVCVASLPVGAEPDSRQPASADLAEAPAGEDLDVQEVGDAGLQDGGTGTDIQVPDGQESGTDSQVPETDGQESETDVQEPGTDSQVPGIQEPVIDEQVPGTDVQEPVTDEQEPVTDIQEPGTGEQGSVANGQEPIIEDQDKNDIVGEVPPQTVAAADGVSMVEQPVWEAVKDASGNIVYQLLKSSEGGIITYYTAEDGIISVKTADGTIAWYLFNEAGFMATGQWELEAAEAPAVLPKEAGTYYFMEAKEATLLPGGTDKANPAQSNVGQMQKAYWIQNGNQFVYFSGVDGKQKALEKRIYTIDGTKYYLDAKGNIMKNAQAKGPNDGYYYYFGADGKMVKSALCNVSGKLYYFSSSGRRSNKVNYVGKVKGKLYYFGSGAYVITTYRGWKKLNNQWYYFDSKGNAKTGWLTDGVKKYWLKSNGVMATGWVATQYGNRYYFNSSGVMLTGWQKIGTYYYYFTKTGWAVRDRIYNGYYFSPKAGIMMTGLRQIDGNGYFFKKSTATARNGKMYKSTWIHVGSKYYYATASGKLATGWNYIKKKWYYLSPHNYVMWASRWGSKNGTKGYFDSSGVFNTGWVKYKTSSGALYWRYVDDPKMEWAKGWKYIKGYKYYFNSSGNLVQDMRSLVGGPYKLEVNRVQGVLNVFAKDPSTGTMCIPVVTFLCSVGLPGTPTPWGTFSVSKAGKWQPLMGPSWGQYAMHVDGAGAGGIFIHSVAGSRQSIYSLPAREWNELGRPRSHGCIRVCVGDAYWIWKHVSTGSSIRIYDSSTVGPFDKPAMRTIGTSQSWDPTDPAITGKW